MKGFLKLTKEEMEKVNGGKKKEDTTNPPMLTYAINIPDVKIV